MAHEIRLAGPWELAIDGKETVRCQLPFDCEPQPANDGFALRRKFHRPSGLETTDTLHIVVSADQPLLQVRLNDDSIKAEPNPETGELKISRFEITQHLREFNVLEINNVAGEPSPNHIEAVWLRIESKH